MEIPRLNIKVPIIGIPFSNGDWDLTWLGDQAGYLDGTAYPTHVGNSVITAHVYTSNGLPGPFVNLSTLKWGDQIIIHFAGQQYIYEVRENKVILPSDKSVFKHEDQAWITLITCKDYNASANSYNYRIVVGAVLVKVEPDRVPIPAESNNAKDAATSEKCRIFLFAADGCFMSLDGFLALVPRFLDVVGRFLGIGSRL